MKDAAFVAPSITMMPVLPWMMAYTVLVTMFTAIALTPSLTPAVDRAFVAPSISVTSLGSWLPM